MGTKELLIFYMPDNNICINSMSFILHDIMQNGTNILFIITKMLLKNLIKHLILYCNLVNFKETRNATVNS